MLLYLDFNILCQTLGFSLQGLAQDHLYQMRLRGGVQQPTVGMKSSMVSQVTRYAPSIDANKM